jgi:hypothetical protein
MSDPSLSAAASDVSAAAAAGVGGGDAVDGDLEVSLQISESEQRSLAELLASVTLSSAPKKACALLDGKPLTIASIAELIRERKVTRICVMSGAGISVAAGIPDFRTPGTGLYDNLQRYQLPFPEAIFEMTFFRTNPKPFFLYGRAAWLQPWSHVRRLAVWPKRCFPAPTARRQCTSSSRCWRRSSCCCATTRRTSTRSNASPVCRQSSWSRLTVSTHTRALSLDLTETKTARFVWRRSLHRLPRRCDH